MEHVFGQGRTSADQQKYKSGNPIGLPYLERDGEYRRTAGAGQVGRSKSPKPKLRDKSCSGDGGDYDELVKHMSNLPGFLQQVEKENSIQEKALNFGVLEWKRLEKWKYTERMPRNPPKRTSSNNNSVRPTSGPPKMSPILRNQYASDPHSSSSFNSGKHPLPRGPLFGSPPRQQPLHDNSYLNLAKDKKNASCHEEEKYGRRKLKGKEIYNQVFHDSETGGIGRLQMCHDQRLLFNNRSSETNADHRQKNDLMEEVILGKDVSVSGLGKHKFSASSANKINSLGKKSEMQSDGALKFTTGSSHVETGPQTIVLPVPNHHRKNSCLEGIQCMESRTSVDENCFEMDGNRLSDFSSIQEFDVGELSGDTSYSCPLPSVSSDPTWCSIEPHNAVNSPQAMGSETSSRPIQTVKSPFLTKSGSKGSAMNKETSTLSCSTEGSNKRPAGLAEKPVVSGRASSPTHRFSFDLGRMGRSFSFKDNSVIPQLNSTEVSAKSGKVRPEICSRTGIVGKDKEAGASKARRSSPLRRLLDPLLKHKGTEAAEAVRTPKSSMPSRTLIGKGKSRDKKSDASLLQALFQLTLKNGRPCFKLVVDNHDDMLAAAVKSLPTSGKSDRCMIYTFYSVHEIRKKSIAWITQGSKSKNCSLGYDIVGQMKISNIYPPPTGNTRSSSECEETECVLYGANPGQEDKQAAEFVSSGEVAAIIVKKLIKGLDGGQFIGPNQCRSAETLNTEENKRTDGTTVILPGGVHGTPVKGAPSSLISRWKSGGLCDCGGWDVGCKLRILADDKSNSINTALTCTSNADRLNLLLQGGEQRNKHAFNLVPLGNGLYSVEFDTSISLLEAFATCVAYLTCRKFPELIDVRGQSDAEQRSAQNITHAPCPPLSPAGRI